MMSHLAPFTPLLVPFLIGLFGSTHCLGMCGGIVTAINASNRNRQRHLSQLLFNLGRINTYVFIGLFTGFFGQVLFSHNGWKILLSLRIIAAITMLAVGFYLLGKTQSLAWVEKFGQKFWRYISPLTKHFMPIDSLGKALGLGMIWGWLPCGLVYSALIISLAQGSMLQSAQFMALFGLGTLPAMLGFGISSDYLRKKLGNRFKQYAQVLTGTILLLAGLWTLFAVIISAPEILQGRCTTFTESYQYVISLLFNR